jgi:hypothetical protein
MENSTLTYIVAAVATVAAVMVIFKCKEKYTSDHTEGFDAAGLTLTHPPNWWFPQTYDISKWLTRYYPDQLSQPACLSYNRGDDKVLNYLSSSYRFWRF